jgi:hypothetical protein
VRDLVILLACVPALGCGRIGYDPFGDLDDAGIAIDATTTTLDAGPFGQVTALDTINAFGTDVDPSITADGRQLFFCSNRTGNFEIYVSVRAAIDDQWPAPTVVDSGNVSTAAIEQNPAISADGLTLYFTRSGDIYQATRASPGADTFAAASAITELNTGSQDTLGSITPDELALTFFSTRPGGQGSADIYLATRPNLSSMWTFEPMPGDINTSAVEADSFLSADRLTLFFDSDRNASATDYNIYTAQRASPDDPFGTPVPVAELNTAEADGDAWLTLDGNTIYFSKGPIFGNLDIHVATR